MSKVGGLVGRWVLVSLPLLSNAPPWVLYVPNFPGICFLSPNGINTRTSPFPPAAASPAFALATFNCCQAMTGDPWSQAHHPYTHFCSVTCRHHSSSVRWKAILSPDEQTPKRDAAYENRVNMGEYLLGRLFSSFSPNHLPLWRH